MLHGPSKPLELYWLEFFDKFGIVEQTVSQVLYNVWYIKDRLKGCLHVKWHLIVGE